MSFDAKSIRDQSQELEIKLLEAVSPFPSRATLRARPGLDHLLLIVEASCKVNVSARFVLAK